MGSGKIRGRGVHRQAWQRLGADVADGQVDVPDITLLGHRRHLLDITGIEHDTGQTGECTTTNADTSDMFHLIAVALDERRTRAHRNNDGVVEFRFKTCAKTVGNKFL